MKLDVSENGNLLTVKNANIEAVFNKSNGQMTSLLMNGKQIISQGNGFVYDNHRWIENDKFTETGNGLEEKGTCTVTEKMVMLLLQQLVKEVCAVRILRIRLHKLV